MCDRITFSIPNHVSYPNYGRKFALTVFVAAMPSAYRLTDMRLTSIVKLGSMPRR
jgi:hypothetical protein